MPKCPQCSILLSNKEAAGEECPVCSEPLNTPSAEQSQGRITRADYAPPSAPASRPSPSPAAPARPSPSRCDVCCQSKPAVQSRFFKLYRMRLSLLGTVTTRWLLIACRCCEECFRQRIRDVRRRMWLTLAMVAMPLVALFAIV